MDELTPVCQMKDLPLGGSTTCRRESLTIVSRCLEIIDVCIWRMFVFMFVVVTVRGSVGILVVYGAVVKNSVFLALEC